MVGGGHGIGENAKGEAELKRVAAANAARAEVKAFAFHRS